MSSVGVFLVTVINKACDDNRQRTGLVWSVRSEPCHAILSLTHNCQNLCLYSVTTDPFLGQKWPNEYSQNGFRVLAKYSSSANTRVSSQW